MEVKEAFMGNPQFKETNYYGAESMCSICGMAYSEHDYDNPNMCWEGKNAESFSADSISICGICSVAWHPHCGQTTGCPCCEIRVKKESQRPTCGDCGELKSSTPQEYNQWTCWPCVDRAGGSYHGTECYCSQCMSYENYAESVSEIDITYMCSVCGADSNSTDPNFLARLEECAKKCGERHLFCNDGEESFSAEGDSGEVYSLKMALKAYKEALEDCLDGKYGRDDAESVMDDLEEYHPIVRFLNAESHGYSYAYNDGHSDARKRDEYRPNLSSTKQESDFKKILKQKAEFASHDFMRGAINPFTQDSMLPVGTLVRSYDFGYPAGDGDKAFVDISCYKEGIIEKIAPSPRCAPDCMHYHIKATKTVWGGKRTKKSTNMMVTF